MPQRFILIVNDDASSCKLFNAYCQYLGHHAQSVVNAEQALSQLTRFHPDLIILDMKLPGMEE